MKILVDCRYVRFDRHDGISRFSSRVTEALAKLHPVTMLVHDERQLALLPDLPWEKIGAPTSLLEPLVEGCRPKGKTPPGDLRRTMAAILWRHQNGAKWRAIPEELWPWWRAAHIFIRSPAPASGNAC